VKDILICGDSFAITDPNYPGLHWSEKISSHGYSISNLALGGSTNSQIKMQVHQGMSLNPDFVVVLFTSPNRAEFDKNINVSGPDVLSDSNIRNYNFARYDTSCYQDQKKNKFWFDYLAHAASQDFEIIKEYFTILGTLQYLESKCMPFCWSLGGFQYDPDLSDLLSKNVLKNELIRYEDRRIHLDLWAHTQQGEDIPWFHVPDEKILESFSNECLQHIKNSV
jgi:hypothetical protein